MTQVAAISLSCILRNCVTLSAISQAKQTHTQILARGFLPNVTLQTDLLLAYSKCGSLKDAFSIFNGMIERNMHSWNIIIYSHVQNSLFNEALAIFNGFLKVGLRPDHFTLPSIFKACTGLGDSRLGKNLHTWVFKLGLGDHVVVESSVLDLYAKCGNLMDAHRLFVKMSRRDVVVWNTMISGFGRAGDLAEVFGCFREMQRQRVKIDLRTVASILNACGRGGDLMKGKEIHGHVFKNAAFNGDVVIGNSLIDMYAKCGFLCSSEKVFVSMQDLNLVTWTTLISCYAFHGKGKQSLDIFEKMEACGFKPNSVTFTAVLASCSHSGLVDHGWRIFESMTSNYGMKPMVEHYACMVDLLSRLGYLKEALELIEKMPEQHAPSVWGALLGACRIHKNLEIGEIAAHRLFDVEPKNPSNYIALCSIYDSVGRMDGVLRIRSRMRELGLVKTPGCSWITIKSKVHRFYQGDISDTRVKMICETLDKMILTVMLPDGYG
ncbi:pentatricopeptide repeat-containing protein At5g04780, mitochondrial-like [Macadamia integrifolia]|uniref:pentatricopeptide repeat-containing protein At5g04780, mitochondrial-like n=1 Tax=Macadamia integrifolia TaxID=60698 RepID=UPI001C4EC2B2|nr:pentatricopeptide repeat-containing protein At5g04780, mitochondrial-like [Macadamia integrifolia]